MVDKVLELCFRSIVQHLAGDKELSDEYKELALEEYQDIKCMARLEEHVPKQVKRKLYEMVS